jgi:peptide chain release factor 3
MISREYIIYEQNINLFSGDNRKNIEETIAFRTYKPRTRNNNWSKPADTLREELE